MRDEQDEQDEQDQQDQRDQQDERAEQRWRSGNGTDSSARVAAPACTSAR
jgi:hypothetical protein